MIDNLPDNGSVTNCKSTFINCDTTIRTFFLAGTIKTSLMTLLLIKFRLGKGRTTIFVRSWNSSRQSMAHFIFVRNGITELEIQ